MHFEILGSRTAVQIPTLRRGPPAPSRSASADALNALASTKWPASSSLTNVLRIYMNKHINNLLILFSVV